MWSHFLSHHMTVLISISEKFQKRKTFFFGFYVVLLILDFQLAAKAARFPSFFVGDKAEPLLWVGESHLRLSYCSLPRLQEKNIDRAQRRQEH